LGVPREVNTEILHPYHYYKLFACPVKYHEVFTSRVGLFATSPRQVDREKIFYSGCGLFATIPHAKKEFHRDTVFSVTHKFFSEK
jgi:hypothetical protein